MQTDRDVRHECTGRTDDKTSLTVSYYPDSNQSNTVLCNNTNCTPPTHLLEARPGNQNNIRDIFYQISKGAFEILDLFWTNFGPFFNCGSSLYADGFRGPGILIKRLWTFLYAAWLRGPDISQNVQKRLNKYPKIDCRAFALILVEIQGGGECPLCPR